MDRLMIDYLRNRGMGGMNEQEWKHKFKDFMTKYRRNSMSGGSRGMSRNSMRYEEDNFPMERMDDFYRHGRPGEFMEHDFDEFDRYSLLWSGVSCQAQNEQKVVFCGFVW